MEECNISSVEDMRHGALVQRQIESGTYERILPQGNTIDKQIKFHIHSSDHYIELDKTELDIKFRVQKKKVAGELENITADDNVGIINYPGACLFKAVDVKLRGKQITTSGYHYSLRAIMETLLSFGHDASESWLQSGLFFKDTAGKMDVVDVKAGDNKGLKERAKFIGESRVVQTRTKLHLDLFQQSKPLINNVDMQIEFLRNTNEYLLMTGDVAQKFEVVIDEMSLLIRKVKMTADVMKENLKVPIPYILNRVEIREFTVESNTNISLTNTVYEGKLPKKVVIALVNNKAHVGDFKKNPFHFEHFNVSDVDFRVNGSTLNGYPLKMNFKENMYNDGYWSLFRTMDQRYRDEGCLVSREEYKGGYTFFAFDISPSQCGDDFVDPAQHGTLSLKLVFAEKTKEALTICVYLQFENDKIVLNELGDPVTYYG